MTRQKFLTGDKVILKRKWQLSYNGIGNRVGTVIEIKNVPQRLKYFVIFEGKKFVKELYSYQLDLVHSAYD